MQVQIALRLVEGDRRQAAGHHIGQKVVGDGAVARAAIAQVQRTLGRARAELLEVIERLVVVLEVGPLAPTLVVQCGLPGAAIPGPAHALARQQVADGVVGLGRQGARVVGVGQGRVAARGRLDVTGLERRCHGVDGIAVGGDGPVVHVLGLAVQGRGRAVGRQGQAAAGGAVLGHRDAAACRGVGGIEVLGRAPRHQKLVVQVRAPKGRHEKAVAQGVLLGQLPQAELLA